MPGRSSGSRTPAEPDDLLALLRHGSSIISPAELALRTECPVVAAAGCSISVTANVYAKGVVVRLYFTGDIFMTPSLPTPGVQASGSTYGVDVAP
jgi:hypothetical protein